MDVYEAIETRRDVRHFRSDPVPEAALARILRAAHHAPSVGFSQPWDFVLIRSRETRAAVKASFERERAREAARFEGARAELYRSLKLEGILESPLNVCVTCDRERGAPVLGRTGAIDMDLFSTCLAVQNLWLAARCEGLGIGWVSILDRDELVRLLGLPAPVVPVAYLCLGYPEKPLDRPELESVGWRDRVDLRELVHDERFEAPAPAGLLSEPAP